MAQAAIPLGAVVAGVAMQRAGQSRAIAGIGVVHVVTMIGMFFNPALREMDARREQAAKPADVRAAAQDGRDNDGFAQTDIHWWTGIGLAESTEDEESTTRLAPEPETTADVGRRL